MSRNSGGECPNYVWKCKGQEYSAKYTYPLPSYCDYSNITQRFGADSKLPIDQTLVARLQNAEFMIASGWTFETREYQQPYHTYHHAQSSTAESNFTFHLNGTVTETDYHLLRPT